MKARIGMVNFINTAPLYTFWQQRAHPAEWVVVEGAPTTLNRMLRAGELDLGFVSSHEYAARPDLYRLLDGISISASGAVGSVFLFTRLPLAQLAGKRVGLSSQSQTSVALVKIILEQLHQVLPLYSEHAAGAGLEGLDALLAIGDEALRLRRGGGFAHCLDLGEIWRSHTGLPFVFAVWAVRDAFYRQHPETVEEIRRELLTCVRLGAEELPAVCRQVAPRIPMEVDACERYLRGIEYDLAEAKKEGLARFYHFLIERGEASTRALPMRLV